VKADAALFAEYDFASRQVNNHRAQIREHHELREPTVGDEDKLIVWLAGHLQDGDVAGPAARRAAGPLP
jgi:hypothetical protein